MPTRDILVCANDDVKIYNIANSSESTLVFQDEETSYQGAFSTENKRTLLITSEENKSSVIIDFSEYDNLSKED